MDSSGQFLPHNYEAWAFTEFTETSDAEDDR